MTDNELNQPMSRVYDTRVLEKGALYMWTSASLYWIAPGLHGVFLTSDWAFGAERWGLSFSERTVYSSRSIEDAASARDEWNAMIKSARLLAGVDRA